MSGLLLGVYVVTSAAILALAIPLIRRKVAPNDLYGLRVEATLADESVWYEANARSGWDMLLLGLLLLALAFVLPLTPLDEGTVGLLWCAVAVVGALMVAVIGTRRANRLLRERVSG